MHFGYRYTLNPILILFCFVQSVFFYIFPHFYLLFFLHFYVSIWNPLSFAWISSYFFEGRSDGNKASVSVCVYIAFIFEDEFWCVQIIRLTVNFIQYFKASVPLSCGFHHLCGKSDESYFAPVKVMCLLLSEYFQDFFLFCFQWLSCSAPRYEVISTYTAWDSYIFLKLGVDDVLFQFLAIIFSKIIFLLFFMGVHFRVC